MLLGKHNSICRFITLINNEKKIISKQWLRIQKVTKRGGGGISSKIHDKRVLICLIKK